MPTLPWQVTGTLQSYWAQASLSFTTELSSRSSGLFSGVHTLKSKCINQTKKHTFFFPSGN